MIPSINWTSYFHIIFKEIIPPDEQIVVLYASEYMAELEQLIRSFDTR